MHFIHKFSYVVAKNAYSLEYVVKAITAGNFKYTVQVPFVSCAFKYESKEFISKSECIFLNNENIKEIDKENANCLDNSDREKSVVKAKDKQLNDIEVTNIKIHNANNVSNIDNFTNIDYIKNAKNLSMRDVKSIDVSKDISLKDASSEKEIDKADLYSISKESVIKIDKSKILNGLNRIDTGFIFAKHKRICMYKNDNLINKIVNKKSLYINDDKKLLKFKGKKLVYRIELQHIAKEISSKFIYRNNKINISKDKFKCFDKVGKFYLDKYVGEYISNKLSIRYVDKSQQIDLNKNNIVPIMKVDSINVNRLVLQSIFKENEICLNKFYVDIFKHIGIELNKSEAIDIFKKLEYWLNKFDFSICNLDKTKFLDVTKRWWVFGATIPTDQLIIPNIDYPYETEPVMGVKMHPISGSLYINNIDVGLGCNEIGVSIEVMVEMLNILTMIWHHAASQFACATGQEAIEFICELLLDWFNLEDTRNQMIEKGSLEHYMRCYRWIRWEAEKVWFKAIDDHTFNGIKYAGMLVANLIEYMKNHHFNVVPIWQTPSKMDCMRDSLLNPLHQGELMKPLDKRKGKRKYLIETQNFEKNSRR